MSYLPPPLPENTAKSVECRIPIATTSVAWTLGGAIFGAIGLVAAALVSGVPKEYWGPVAPLVSVGLTIIALIGANAGGLIGLLVSGFRRKDAPKSALNNSKADLPPPQESGDKPVKRGWPVMAIVNTGIALGGPVGAFGGLLYFSSLTKTQGEFSMGIFLLPFQVIGFLFLAVS